MSIVINAVSSGLQRSYKLASAHDSIRRNLGRYKNFPKKTCDEQIAVADTHLSSSMDSSGNDKSPITLSNLDACDQLLDEISTTVEIMHKAVDPEHGLDLPDDYEGKSSDYFRHQQDRIVSLLDALISKINLGAITDVSDQFVMIKLKGNKIYELFQTGSPFNFNSFQNKKGAVTQTILNKIDIIVHNQDKNAVNLFVRRSFSQHLFSWMNDAASRL